MNGCGGTGIGEECFCAGDFCACGYEPGPCEGCPDCDADAMLRAEAEAIADHCRVNNITHHSIDADGNCNMGCC